MSLQSNISIERGDILQPTRLGNALNNGNQPGKPLDGRSLTGTAYIWGGGSGNISTLAAGDFGGDNKQEDTRLTGNFNLSYDIAPSLKAIASVGYNRLSTDYRTVEKIIQWTDYAGTFKEAFPTRSSYQRGDKTETNFTTNGYLEYSKVLNTAHSIKAVAGVQYERFTSHLIGSKKMVNTSV